jgi:hypothetical protein
MVAMRDRQLLSQPLAVIPGLDTVMRGMFRIAVASVS